MSPRRIAARVNLAAMKVAGFVSPTTLLTMAKLVPHITHIPTRLRSAKTDLYGRKRHDFNFYPYSHSIVAGGFGVMS
jgi:hypothetical protein